MAPYPQHLETTVVLHDGTPIELRPVRPDDEPLLNDLFAHMSREDVRLRFFVPMRELGHALGDRLTHIDYDRQMALMALHDGVILGVGRYAADDDRRRAEYAVAVRSDWHGRGVGYLLMQRVIELARAAGIAEIYGDVLHENHLMLQMSRELGFSIAAHPGDASLVRVSKALA